VRRGSAEPEEAQDDADDDDETDDVDDGVHGNFSFALNVVDGS
jgi:hypothetical protein